jgi:hypothetical protein
VRRNGIFLHLFGNNFPEKAGTAAAVEAQSHAPRSALVASPNPCQSQGGHLTKHRGHQRDEPMRMWPISTRVNKPENDDPSIIEPIELATDAACRAGARFPSPRRNGFCVIMSFVTY